MEPRRDRNGRPIGRAMPEWNGAAPPPRTALEGRYCRLEPIDPARHADDLFEAFSLDESGANYTYLGYEPFTDAGECRAYIEANCLGQDPHFYAFVDPEDGKAKGMASYLRIDPKNGVIEVGHIHFSPLLQRRPAATEAMYLMMRQVFDVLGYRRYEWKCDSLNAPSRRAALRYGFTYDGMFEQAIVYKGRNRDTTWFSVLDRDWPRVKAGFEAWLAQENFDSDGRQRRRLEDCRPPSD